jgi:hypothetical protein
MVIAANFSLQKCRLTASSVAEKLSEELHKFIQFTRRVLGADVVTTVVMSKSRRHHEWIGVGCDFDVDIAVVSFEEGVVDGLVFFDEIILEVERLEFALHCHEIHLGCFVEHVLLPDRSCSKILRNTIAKILGLPDIEYRVFRIVEKIDSRFGGDGCEVREMKRHNIIYRDMGGKMRDEKKWSHALQ